MSVRTSKGQTKAAKGTEPKLVKDLKVARRSRVSKKAVAFSQEPALLHKSGIGRGKLFDGSLFTERSV